MRTTHSATYRRPARRPVSARRAAAYDQTASATVHPEKFFDSRVKLAAVCPETALLSALPSGWNRTTSGKSLSIGPHPALWT
jgi:hypothetical protein